ncbi:MAG: hypothetical protein PHI18_03530 [bacterium]|nr:hypothetical protein [bacterium]
MFRLWLEGEERQSNTGSAGEIIEKRQLRLQLGDTTRKRGLAPRR